MKKGTIIIGKQSSGKTTLAKEIASQYLEHEVVWIDRDYDEAFAFQECTQDTKLVVVDDIECISCAIGFFGSIEAKIQVQKPLCEPFFIDPKLILVYQLQNPQNERFKEYLEKRHPLYNVIGCEANNQPEQ